MTDQAIVPVDPGAVVRASGVDDVLRSIRPYWQAKPLIQRVRRLLDVDPSSACQRLFNAAIQDLQMKIVQAGLDIAAEAAAGNGLPPLKRAEDVMENYSATNTLDLAYRMGILQRAEWRRLGRAYEIRRDLEHEDDAYEASREDLVYVFATCIETVLSRDPVELLRVADVKELVQSAVPVALSADFLHDFGSAPDTRKLEIGKYLISTALASDLPDIVRQNAVEALRAIRNHYSDQVKIELAKQLQGDQRRGALDTARMKVGAASGTLLFLRQTSVQASFESYASRLDAVGPEWRNFASHAAILEELADIGGLQLCPDGARQRIVLWMVRCYVGEPGGYGTVGRNRKVFYSNSAAPLITRMFREAGTNLHAAVVAAGRDSRVRNACNNLDVARRYEELVDLVE